MSTKTHKSSSPLRASVPRHLAWWQQPGTWLFSIVVTIVGTLIIFGPSSLPDVSAHQDYQFRLSETVMPSENKWVPTSLPEQVIQLANLPESVSLLRPKLCEDIAKSWQMNPWVKSVTSVKITRDAQILVEAEYRTPVAFVEVPQSLYPQGGLYPVDAEGVLLPPTDFAYSDTDRLPRIRGVKSLPQSGAGQVWDDPVVLSGAQLSSALAPGQDLEPVWNRYEFSALVAQDGPTPHTSIDEVVFDIETQTGHRITWGHVGSGSLNEPGTETKLARIQEFMNRAESMDKSIGPQRLDVRLTESPDGSQRYR